jgi:hypothetical protein
MARLYGRRRGQTQVGPSKKAKAARTMADAGASAATARPALVELPTPAARLNEVPGEPRSWGANSAAQH